MTSLATFPAEYSNVRGGETGFRIAQHNSGHWWWIDPRDQPQVVCGVHGVDANVGPIPADMQVGQWGVNLLVPPVADGFCGTNLPYGRDLQLSRSGAPLIHEDGVLLPDVFDPIWAEMIEQVFNAVQPTPMLAAWIGDCELRWGALLSDDLDTPTTRPGLLQVCLGLDPAYRAYHSAWEFVLARHGGELEDVAQTWGLELPSRGAVRQLTRDEQVFDAPAYRRDLEAFTGEFAQRYFSLCREASQKVNPGCLLGSPVLNEHTPAAVLAVASTATDFLLVTQPDLVEGNAPRLVVDYNWARTEPVIDAAIGESVLEALVRGGREHLTALLRNPEVMGYAWAPFRRGDLATDAPYVVGLVDENGRENAIHTHPLAAINAVAAQIKSASV